MDVQLMMIETPGEFFEKVLPIKFDPKKAAGIDGVIQMNITGPEGGDWTVIIKDQKMEVKKGVHPSPEIAIKVSDSDFVDLINSKLKALEAFMSGKIEFKGSLKLGLKLMDVGFI